MNRTNVHGVETFLVTKPYRFSPRGVGLRSSQLREFLKFHGFLDDTKDVDAALREFQQRHQVPSTGRLNFQTCRLLNSVRCAHPELPRTVEAEHEAFMASTVSVPRLASTTGVANPEIHVDLDVAPGHEYEIVRARWTRRRLGYAFVGTAPAYLGDIAWDAIRSAFRTWSEETIINIEERDNPRVAEIRVLWTPGRSADPTSPDPFYGPGEKIAVGYYPLPFSGELAGDLHFDTSESWSTSGSGDTFDIETVCLHEIGHCLGLGHSRNHASAMYSTYKTQQRYIIQADADEIERKYQDVT